MDIQIIKLCVQEERKGRIRLNSMQGEGREGTRERKKRERMPEKNQEYR